MEMVELPAREKVTILQRRGEFFLRILVETVMSAADDTRGGVHSMGTPYLSRQRTNPFSVDI